MSNLNASLVLSIILISGCASTEVKQEVSSKSPNLNDAQLKALLVGKTIGNKDFIQTMNEDGTVVGKSYSRGNSDEGTYTIKDGKYCSKWKIWRDGSKACWTMKKRSNDYYAKLVSGSSRSFKFTVK